MDMIMRRNIKLKQFAFVHQKNNKSARNYFAQAHRNDLLCTSTHIKHVGGGAVPDIGEGEDQLLHRGSGCLRVVTH